MRKKIQQVGLILLGLVAGVLISLNFSASAQKDDVGTALPVEELRSFADVFNAIKQGYVEPIEDKKLITHAISGMLSNLAPHSAYLDADTFKDLAINPIIGGYATWEADRTSNSGSSTGLKMTNAKTGKVNIDSTSTTTQTK